VTKPSKPPIPAEAIMDLTAQDTIEKLLDRKTKAFFKLRREIEGLKNLLNSTESHRKDKSNQMDWLLNKD